MSSEIRSLVISLLLLIGMFVSGSTAQVIQGTGACPTPVDVCYPDPTTRRPACAFNPTLNVGPISTYSSIGNVETYVYTIHPNGNRMPEELESMEGMIREGEGDYGTLETDGTPGTCDAPAIPAEIEAFDGVSLEINAPQPPGQATLRDFYGVDLHSGQVNLRLPTGQGFGMVGSHDTDLSIIISSSVDRRAGLGPFAALSCEDYLFAKVSLSREGCTGTTFLQELEQIVNDLPAIMRYRAGTVSSYQNVGPSAAFVAAPLYFGGYVSQTLDPCNLVNSGGTEITLPSFIMSGTSLGQALIGPYLFGEPTPASVGAVTDLNTFVAPPGVTQVMYRTFCGGTIIVDETGTMRVYGRMYISQMDMGTFDPAAHVLGGKIVGGGQIQNSINTLDLNLVAPLLYTVTQDGLITSYFYNAWGQLKGYRDPYGRIVAFEYGPLNTNAGIISNYISAIEDSFGRRTELTYDSGDMLTNIRLPEVVTGAPGQPTLGDRDIKIAITYEDDYAVNGTPKRLMTGVTVGRPLDSPSAPSLEVDLDYFSAYAGGRSRVASITATSADAPTWMTGTVGGTTTYGYSTNFFGKCPSTPGEVKSVTVTQPDSTVTTHGFDYYGNEVSRVTPYVGGTATWEKGWVAHANILFYEYNPNGTLTAYVTQLEVDSFAWFSGNVLDKKNHREMHLSVTGQSTISTVREFGPWGVMSKERLPGTTYPDWDVERVVTARGAITSTTLQAVTSTIGVQGTPVSTTTFDDFLQPQLVTDPAGRPTSYSYHVINDPDGDSTPNWGSTLFNGSGVPKGYVLNTIVDPITVSNPNGLSLITTTKYDSRGRLIESIDPRGVKTQSRYNEMDQAFATAVGAWTWSGTAFIAPSSGAHALTRYHYDENGRATVKDVYNNNPDTVAVAPFVRTEYVYDGLDQLLQINQAIATPGSSTLAWAHQYFFRDSMGRVLHAVDPSDSVVSATYTPHGKVMTNRKHAVKATISGGGPVLGSITTDSADIVYSATYTSDGRLVTVTDPVGAVETLLYDPYLRKVGRIDPANTTLLRELDGYGAVESEEIRNSSSVLLKRTEYSYDEGRRIIERREKWLDHTLTVVDDGWVETQYGYDLAGVHIATLDDQGNLTTQVHDGAARVKEIVYPVGLNYPSLSDRDFLFYDAGGNITRKEFSEVTPSGSVSVFSLENEFDALGRLTAVHQDPDGSAPEVYTSVFDSMGNVIRSLKPTAAGIMGTVLKVDTSGRLVKSESGWNSAFTAPIDSSASGGDGLITNTKTYDVFGHLLSETDDVASTHVTTYLYDAFHRLTKVTHADGAYETTTYRKDNLASVFSVFTSGATKHFDINYTYDSAKRRTLETYDYPTSVTSFGLIGKAWAFDSLGRKTESWALSKHPIDPTLQYLAHTTFGNDSLGRVLHETHEQVLYTSGTPQTVHTYTIDRTYDSYGNNVLTESSRGTDSQGFRVQRTFDALSRMTSVAEIRTGSDPAIEVEFAWQGVRSRLVNSTHWNGTETKTIGFDGRGRPLNQFTGPIGQTAVAGRVWTYNPGGTVHTELHVGLTGKDYKFTHDGWDRLNEIRQGDWNTGTQTFTGSVQLTDRTFDGAGSTSSLSAGIEGGTLSTLTTAIDTTNAYTQFGSKTVTRDARGNTTQIGSEYFGYDALGHLIAWIDNSLTTPPLNFEILDAEDRRVARYVGTTGTAYLYDGDLLIQEENMGTATVIRERVYGPGQDHVVGERVGGTPFAIHCDVRSTPYASTDDAGDLVETYDTEPFGKTVATLAAGVSQSLDLRIGLHGAWRDPVTGRLFMRARTYDPELGRFLSRDPIGMWGDVLNSGNAYGFVGNSPTIYIDPYGLWGWFSDLVESVSSAVTAVASVARDVVAGAVDGAITGVTMGLVEGPVVANLLGADTESTAYKAGAFVGEVAAEIGINAATGGSCNAVKIAAKAWNTVGDLLETYKTMENASAVIHTMIESGELDKAAGASLLFELAGAGNRKKACFPAGTLVWTTSGLVAIEEVQPGATVHAYDESTGSYTTATVSTTMAKEWTGDLVTMQVAGESVTATGNHPFFVVSGEDLFSRPVPEELAHEPATTTAYSLFGRWVEARDLRVGDHLLGPDGDSLPISALASETKTLFVYNLNVVSPDTYLISSIGLVVHNADKCGADAPKGGGRTGDQARLRELGADDKVSSADRGWIKQEQNSIERGQRTRIRRPPGKELAHERGREAAKGFGYENSNLQDMDLHKLQHKYDDFGRKNRERPVTDED
jgi:RHS repeat-associated protein